MSRYGYGYVPEKAFIAFTRDLSEGAWKDVILAKYDNPDHSLSAAVLDAPRPVTWKLRATWAIQVLRDAVGVSAEVLEQLDVDWDSLQRKLHYSIAIAEEARDPAIREAAARLRGALLLGNGTGQTVLGWEEEVDFGRQQIELTTRGPLAEDAKKISLTPLLEAIHGSTEALARGLGRGPGQRRAAARTTRIREAMTGCVTAFNGIHDELLWFLANTHAGETRGYLEQLLAPFQALLDRNPPSTSDAVTPAAAPSPAAALA
jgi:hypothetical protein